MHDDDPLAPARGICNAVLIVAGVVVWAFVARSALGQDACGERDTVTGNIAHLYGEKPLGRGLNGEGHVVEIWSNPSTGSWSAVVTKPDGKACVVAGGIGWENLGVATGEPA